MGHDVWISGITQPRATVVALGMGIGVITPHHTFFDLMDCFYVNRRADACHSKMPATSDATVEACCDPQ